MQRNVSEQQSVEHGAVQDAETCLALFFYHDHVKQ